MKIADVKALSDCDQVTAEDIEEIRRALGLTTIQFAEALEWSPRKLQRVMEAAREEGEVPRDVTLACVGLVSILDGRTPDADASGGAGRLAGLKIKKEKPPKIFQRYHGPETWSVQVAPSIMRLLVHYAEQRLTTTYGEIAETLEDHDITKRVWPRTVYGMPLGIVCDVVMELGEKHDRKIPPLSAIVTAKGGLPGPGFDGMAKRYFRRYLDSSEAREQIGRLKRDREALIGEMQQEIFDYGDWGKVLEWAGLKPLS